MSLWQRILVVVGTVLLIGALLFIIYKQNQISQQQDAINKSMVSQKELIDGIVRSQSQFASKEDLQKFASDNNINLDAINKDLAALHADLSSINKITVNSNGQSVNGVPSTNTTPGTNTPDPNAVAQNPDPYGYMKNKQNLELNEDFSGTKVPIGVVSFSAWKDKPWDYNINARQYNVVNVIGTDEDGRNYVYNKFTINDGNKNYDVKIATAQTVQEYPTAKLSFNPRLFMGVDGGISVSRLPVQGEFTPSVGMGFLSYGKTKVQPDWSFAQVGVGFDVATSRPQVLVTPVAYNLGQNIPFVKNTYVAPSIGVETDGSVYVGVGARVGF